MEVRTMKTCYGLQRLLFLDGALVHPNVDNYDVVAAGCEILKMSRTNHIEGFAVLDEARELTPEDYKALQEVIANCFADNQLTAKLYGEDRPLP